MKYQGCQDLKFKLPFPFHPWFSENTSTCGKSLLLYYPEMLIKRGLPVKHPINPSLLAPRCVCRRVIHPQPLLELSLSSSLQGSVGRVKDSGRRLQDQDFVFPMKTFGWFCWVCVGALSSGWFLAYPRSCPLDSYPTQQLPSHCLVPVHQGCGPACLVLNRTLTFCGCVLPLCLHISKGP